MTLAVVPIIATPTLQLPSGITVLYAAAVAGGTGTVGAVMGSCVVGNPGSSNSTITIYRVPSGGTPSLSNVLVPATSVAVGSSQVLSQLQGCVLSAGDSIQAVPSVAGVLNVTLSGYTFTAS